MDDLEIIFIDIDGTLLRTDHTISHRVKKSLQQVYKRGVEICLSSGRSWEALLPMYNELELEGPAICYNGAVIVADSSGKVVFECGMNEEAARFAIEECRRMGIELIAYGQSRLLYEGLGQEVSRYRQYVSLQGNLVNFDEQHPLGITKCVALGEPEALAFLEESMNRSFSAEQISMTHSNPRFLEMMGPNVNKGMAVKKLSHMSLFNLDAAAAFGDGLNDIEMLRNVAEPWIMNNAAPGLKKLFPSDRVIPGSDYDGLAIILEAFLDGRRPALAN